MGARRETLADMRAAGVDPYPNDFQPTIAIGDLVRRYEPASELGVAWPSPLVEYHPSGVAKPWWPVGSR